MVLNQKPSGTALSFPKGLAVAAIVSLAITLAGCALMSYIVVQEITAESNIGYGIMVILLIASYVSAITACNKIKHRKIAVCLTSGVIYYSILLLITALFFGGQYSGVGETGLLIFAGSLLGILSTSRSNKPKKYPKFKHPYR